jgi:hypothetical protein
MIKRELLLVLKTNNYLRTIDRRLGNPNNTFAVINEVTWSVMKKDMSKNMTFWQYWHEAYRYYTLKFSLFVYYLHLRMKTALGIKCDEEEMKDFELDATYH